MAADTMAGELLIVEADRELVAWLERVGVDASISLEAPGSAGPDAPLQLHAYLLGFASARAARQTSATPTRVGLRYLVTTSGGNAEQVHTALSTVIFAALSRDDLELDLEAPKLELWTCLGIAPRPAFVLGTTVALTRPAPFDRRIESVHTRVAPAIALTGQVLGPGELPVARAVVELPSLGQVARCDEWGRFRFPQCPTNPAPDRIRVVARGLTQEFPVQQPITGGEPIVVRVEMGRME